MADRKTVLITEDSPINRAILSKILSDRYTVLEAENGLVALRLLHDPHHRIDAVLLDLVMPVMDGFAFLEKFRLDPAFSSTPIIVATQNDSQESEIRALRLGAMDFIAKPYSPEIIRQRLHNLLTLRETAALLNSAERDSLTGLFNRSTFYSKANNLISENSDVPFEILCFDLEHFKIINDLFGTNEGDRLLHFIGQQLSELQNGSDFLCGRLGSDLFAVCCPAGHYDWPEICDSFNKKLLHYPLSIRIIVKCGLYHIESPAPPIETMCDLATLAIRSIKGKYGRNFCRYTIEHRLRLLEEQEITDQMNSALAAGEFQAFYQPKFDFVTGHMIGAEALVRWVHPTKGIIVPDKFMPLFERNGFVTLMDLHIWKTVCHDLHNFIRCGLPVFPISINISRMDIYHPKLCEILLGLIKEYKIPIELLELEITETAQIDNTSQLIDTVRQLKEAGFKILMDDFGSGYSSLNLLTQLPIDGLKLDLHFVRNSASSPRSRNILNFVISLARWLKIPIIAEGIETETQAAFLRGMGCTRGQGYFFCKPLPLKKFMSFIKSTTISVPQAPVVALQSVCDESEIWDPCSRFTAFFYEFPGNLALIECCGDSIILLRANDSLCRLLHLPFDEQGPPLMKKLSFFCSAADHAVLRCACDAAKKENSVQSTPLRWYPEESAGAGFPAFVTHLKPVLLSESRSIFLMEIDTAAQ